MKRASAKRASAKRASAKRASAKRASAKRASVKRASVFFFFSFAYTTSPATVMELVVFFRLLLSLLQLHIHPLNFELRFFVILKLPHRHVMTNLLPFRVMRILSNIIIPCIPEIIYLRGNSV